jgi:hypothetical protein
MKLKPTHYVECHCGAGYGENNDSCECNLLCSQWTDNPETTGTRKWVSCKNCLRILQAADRRSKPC